MNELIVIKDKDIESIFVQGGTEPILDKLRKLEDEFVADISTKKGREAVSRFSYAISRSKTYVDKLGADLVADHKAKVKVVDSERKRLRDECDRLRDKSREILTKWEDVEKKRVEDIKAWIQEIITKGEVEYDSLEDIQQAIDELKGIKVDEPMDTTYCEFAGLAVRKIAVAITNLSAAYIVRKKEEDDAAEAKRLKDKLAEDERIDREKKVAEEAAGRAKAEAEKKAREEAEEKERVTKAEAAKAQAVIEKAEAEKVAAKIAATKAEREKKEAADKAVKDAEDAKKKAEEDKTAAVEAEKQKQEEEKKLQEEAERKRTEDRNHRVAIMAEITEDLWHQVQDEEVPMGTGFNSHVKAICDAMVNGQIRHVKVTF